MRHFLLFVPFYRERYRLGRGACLNAVVLALDEMLRI